MTAVMSHGLAVLYGTENCSDLKTARKIIQSSRDLVLYKIYLVAIDNLECGLLILICIIYIISIKHITNS